MQIRNMRCEIQDTRYEILKLWLDWNWSSPHKPKRSRAKMPIDFLGAEQRRRGEREREKSGEAERERGKRVPTTHTSFMQTQLPWRDHCQANIAYTQCAAQETAAVGKGGRAAVRGREAVVSVEAAAVFTHLKNS